MAPGIVCGSVVIFNGNMELSDGDGNAKRMEKRIAMSETAVYKSENFISSGEPSGKLLF